MKKLAIIILILGTLSCKEKAPENKSTIQKLSVNDIKLADPKPGEWLYAHEEFGQTFNQYIQTKPIRPTKDRNVIYLQPIGAFDSLQQSYISDTQSYLRIFFGLDVELLQTMDDSAIPDAARRVGSQGNEQLLATYILDEMLKKRLPQDAIGLMAITAKDLYPRASWNYVFGLSSLEDRVSVTSMYRLHDELDQRKGLSRLIKVSSHEITHMLSMKHCVHALCLMNGSNHLVEVDSKPNRLCSECTAKLTWNINLDPVIRLELLSSFFEQNGLTADHQMMLRDLKTLKVEK